MVEFSKKEQFVELRAKNHSFAKISDQLGVSKPTLIKWSKDLHKEIANLQVVEMEALQEQYFVTKKERIKLLGEQLALIRKELIDRKDLVELSTKELLQLQILYTKALREEEIVTNFKSEEEGLSLVSPKTVVEWAG